MIERYKQIYSDKQIKQRIGQMASEITAKYNGDNPYMGNNPLFIALLRGAAPFASRLMFEISRQAPDFHPELDYMMTSRYADSVIPNDETKIIVGLRPDTELNGRNVIIIDDVLDMGETASTVRDYVLELGARYVELAVLIEKSVERSADISAEYVGFKAPNAWLVGMGMDDNAVSKESFRWRDGVWQVVPGEPSPDPATVTN